jgi:hypothetical protein
VKTLKILLSILVHVVIFDVIGVVVSFVVDVLPLAFASRALFYAICVIPMPQAAARATAPTAQSIGE